MDALLPETCTGGLSLPLNFLVPPLHKLCFPDTLSCPQCSPPHPNPPTSLLHLNPTLSQKCSLNTQATGAASILSPQGLYCPALHSCAPVLSLTSMLTAQGASSECSIVQHKGIVRFCCPGVNLPASPAPPPSLDFWVRWYLWGCSLQLRKEVLIPLMGDWASRSPAPLHCSFHREIGRKSSSLSRGITMRQQIYG